MNLVNIYISIYYFRYPLALCTYYVVYLSIVIVKQDDKIDRYDVCIYYYILLLYIVGELGKSFSRILYLSTPSYFLLLRI